MEDFEVRQALAVIKERVNAIKNEPDWKQKIADEWNKEETKSANSYVSACKSFLKFRICGNWCFETKFLKKSG